MKFNFTIQSYQTDAVESIVQVFKGEQYDNRNSYLFDMGEKHRRYVNPKQILAYSNHQITLTDEQILDNIREIQADSDIVLSTSLNKSLGRCSLDIEMETGTGKTYVYIKTMFELNKRYGWSKFIVVVPSIAIREGVRKSFEITQSHFMDCYGKKARYFIYNSSNLQKLDDFSRNPGINVMIINSQAFAASLNEEGKTKDSRIIYTERDDFQSRRPIDVIAANNPIIILDEPQKLSGKATQTALKKNFNALFSMNFSATHADPHDLIYTLDALDAYNQKLVKKIEVKGIETKNLAGISCYIYLDQILVGGNQPPRAKIEMDISHSNGIKREIRVLDGGDSLYEESNGLEEYRGVFVTDINDCLKIVEFSNGLRLSPGEVYGDISEDNLRKIQIRETIISHIEKEEQLFRRGIKCLSLFFIDKVDNYRRYDEFGNQILGPYGQVFEEEYNSILKEMMPSFDTKYRQYLESFNVESVHAGYFSIDKKTKHVIDSPIKGKSDSSDDVDAYDLILKDKERLLSFEEPTRFIFSHSALREGWDNPNVFQICALKHSNSTTGRRQEVGRGLRLCVDSSGSRMDLDVCKEQIHQINTLTVIAGEGYDSFVRNLQKEVTDELRERPSKINPGLIKKARSSDGSDSPIPTDVANRIYHQLYQMGLIDDDNKPTAKCRKLFGSDEEVQIFEPTSDLAPYNGSVTRLVRSVVTNESLDEWITDGKGPRIKENKLNANYEKREFKALWNEINHKYDYRVEFDSRELIDKSVKALETLTVSVLSHVIRTGSQKEEITEDQMKNGSSFEHTNQTTRVIERPRSSVKYDLVGDVATGASITRRTAATILKEMNSEKFEFFRDNPEEFIKKVSRTIKAQKAAMVIDHIVYNRTNEVFDNDIFTKNQVDCDPRDVFKAKRHITDYVITDGLAEDSVEKRFAEALDTASEVVVYAKLPKGFKIPTPVGDYTPDWAIAFNENSEIKHIYFIAETKGTSDTLQLRPVEQKKIECAKKIYNVPDSKVRYECVTDYATLLNVMRGKES